MDQIKHFQVKCSKCERYNGYIIWFVTGYPDNLVKEQVIFCGCEKSNETTKITTDSRTTELPSSAREDEERESEK